MKKLELSDVKRYVNDHIVEFHQNRLNKLKKLKLMAVLKRKNPYLFKAKNILTAHDLVKTILDAYLSSAEETTFGDFLEGLAIFVCGKIFGGKKSAAQGIDLEFEKDNKCYIVTIKSGPNWGNSSQIRKMRDDFKKAQRTLRTGRFGIHVVAVNGCCYGRVRNPDKGEYFKICGQDFWQFVSGNERLYVDIIEPLGHRAKEKNEEFMHAYAKIVNEFTFEFGEKFCTNGIINWERLVEFNSSQKKKRK